MKCQVTFLIVAAMRASAFCAESTSMARFQQLVVDADRKMTGNEFRPDVKEKLSGDVAV